MLTGLALATIGAVALVDIVQMPYWVLALAIGVSNFGAGQAIPAMNLSVMQSAGPADANLAAASLNASRQIGSLLGVAIASVTLHGVADASAATAGGFGVIAAAYAGGLALVFRYLRPG